MPENITHAGGRLIVVACPTGIDNRGPLCLLAEVIGDSSGYVEPFGRDHPASDHERIAVGVPNFLW